MNFGILLPSIIFGLIGLGIIFYILKVVIGALVGNPLSWLEKQRFSKRLALLTQGDQFLKSGNADSAILAWQEALFLDHIKHHNSLVDTVGNHNLTVLGRIVSLSEKRNSHLASLPLVEGLFTSRLELNRSYFEVLDTLKKLRSRQNDSKKKGASPTPDWALMEFSKKLTEVRSKIDANNQALKTQLEKLFSDIRKVTTSSEITYH